jgi:ABC-2 type transport system permease protein
MQQELVRKIPSPMSALRKLMRADLTVQWRQRRSLLMSVAAPIIFIIAWKSLIPLIGSANVLAVCVAIGIPGTGLMGYSLAIARDRERGVFQRLRATPVPTWVMMSSRIIVQIAMIVFMSLVTCIVAYFYDKITFSIGELLLILVISAIGGLAFIAIGQALVAYIISSDAVSAAARLLYMLIAVLGAIGQVGLFGKTFAEIVTYSPLGTTKTMLAAALAPSTLFTTPVIEAFFITVAYGIFFAVIGISGFRWTSNR